MTENQSDDQTTARVVTVAVFPVCGQERHIRHVALVPHSTVTSRCSLIELFSPLLAMDQPVSGMENAFDRETTITDVLNELTEQETKSVDSAESGHNKQDVCDGEKLDKVDPLQFTGADGKIRTFWKVTEDGEILWDEEKAAIARKECEDQRDKWTSTGPNTEPRTASLFKN